MTDIDTLLKSVAPEVPAPGPDVIDADLARGRAARVAARRRRARRRGVLVAGPVAVAAAAVVVAIGGSSHHATTTMRLHATHGASAGGGAQVELVDYTGAQLPGFKVSEIPQGWQLSTSTDNALLITPNGSTNNDPDVFVGKLAVIASSTAQQGLGSGDSVTVNGQPGKVSHQDGELLLNYNTPNGFGVNIQAPDSLNWTEQQLVQFADGVQVTANAVHTVG